MVKKKKKKERKKKGVGGRPGKPGGGGGGCSTITLHLNPRPYIQISSRVRLKEPTNIEVGEK